jgi:hypothetical protein
MSRWSLCLLFDLTVNIGDVDLTNFSIALMAL